MLTTGGLNPGEYELIYTGMSTLPALLSGGVTAIGAFRNYELLAVEVLGYPPIFFPPEEYGVPNTYELLFVVHPDLLQENLGELRAILGGPGPRGGLYLPASRGKLCPFH